MTCSIPECEKKRGEYMQYCYMHTARIKRHGDPNFSKYPRHGLSRTPEFSAWDHMLQRCHNTKCKAYKWYGARGITVCQRWRESFLSFYEDMGPRPSAQHSLERKDNSKGYELSNCKWATKIEQMNNTRRNVFYSYNGTSLTISQWAVRVGINARTLYARIVEYGWPIQDALNTPVKQRNRT